MQAFPYNKTLSNAMSDGQAKSALDLRAALSGGDRRSIGRVPEVIRHISDEPALFEQLIPLMNDADSVVAMRACDAVEKLTADRASRLAGHTAFILTQVAHRTEAEIRWHVAQLLPRLLLSARQKPLAVSILRGYLNDRSSIVRACALDSFCMLAGSDQAMRDEAKVVTAEAAVSGTPAMKARARRLLKEMN
jgi:hypothetical protein